MRTIELMPNTWSGTLNMMLAIVQNGTHESYSKILPEFQRMAFLADQFGKQLLIEVYSMKDDTISKEADYYDILVRCDGEDPIEEHEGLQNFEEKVTRLEEKFPGAVVVGISA